MNRTVPIVASALALTAIVVAPGASTAKQADVHASRSYRIVTSNGVVTRLGPLRTRDPTLARATAVFGQPSSISGRGNLCNVRWRSRKIFARFVNLGGQTACNPSFGRLQSFTVRSRAWRAPMGLRVGHTTTRLQEMFPTAELRYGVWELVDAYYGYGDTGYVTTVAAIPRNGRVAALTMYVGGAGE